MLPHMVYSATLAQLGLATEAYSSAPPPGPHQPLHHSEPQLQPPHSRPPSDPNSNRRAMSLPGPFPTPHSIASADTTTTTAPPSPSLPSNPPPNYAHHPPSIGMVSLGACQLAKLSSLYPPAAGASNRLQALGGRLPHEGPVGPIPGPDQLQSLISTTSMMSGGGGRSRGHSIAGLDIFS